MNKDDRPRYVISIAAEILSTRTYTLRYYEKVGIIKPYRSPGNIRLYSDDDIALLHRVMTLMEDLGVNLAGVEVILRMSKRLAELKQANEELKSELEKLRRA
jgi:MerR family transcriptional regulator/heat shock protein HspR|tara:strand:- start:48 stop:353 length:306 start_codon:yes stop_codon:yes gene_type:complete